LDACGHLRVNSFLLNVAAFAFALGARIADHAARALARRASSRNAEKTLLIAHLAAASAASATRRRFALRAAGPLAGITTLMPAVCNLGLGAERGFFKFDSDIFAKV